MKESLKNKFSSLHEVFNNNIGNLFELILEKLIDNLNTIDRIVTTLTKVGFTIILIIITFQFWNIDREKIPLPFTDILLYSSQVVYSVFVIIVIFDIWKSKDELKRIYKIIASTIFVIVTISIPITLVILHAGRLISLNDGYKIGTADGWLSFFGSIIGGLVTMLTLIYTIRFTNYQNSKQFSQIIMPVLFCEIGSKSKGQTLIDLIDLKISNISKNALLNLELEKLKIRGYKSHFDLKIGKPIYKEDINSSSYTLKNDVIKPSDSLILGKIIFVEPPLKYRDELIKYLDVTFIFTYTDIYSINRYSVKYKLHFITQNKFTSRNRTKNFEVNKQSMEYVLINQKTKHEFMKSQTS